ANAFDVSFENLNTFAEYSLYLLTARRRRNEIGARQALGHQGQTAGSERGCEPNCTEPNRIDLYRSGQRAPGTHISISKSLIYKHFDSISLVSGHFGECQFASLRPRSRLECDDF